MNKLFLENYHVVMKLNMAQNAIPIGLAADTKGHLYTGSYGGGNVIEIDPM